MKERVLVIRAGGDIARGIRALEGRYPDLEFVYCESFLSGIVEASRGSVRAMLARVDGGPRRLTEAVGALREAGGDEAKIVLCCAPEHEPQAREALAGGADDYVIEPVQAADVDRAIGYGRADDLLMAQACLMSEPVASMEELAGIGEILGLMDAPPRELLQRAADLIREALEASAASIVVEGTVARSGEISRAVLTSPLRNGERVIGQVGVAERNVETSRRQNVKTRRDEGTKGRRDEGEGPRGIEGSRDQGIEGRAASQGTAHRAVAHGSTGGQAASGTPFEVSHPARGSIMHGSSGPSGHRSPSAGGGAPKPVSQGERGLPYTLGDAQKLERYAEVLSRVLAVAGRQRELTRLAVMDEASGLPNRRYLREQLGAILERAAAERFAVTVLLFDVDDFKSYNDRYGHAAGDEILRVAGELFRKNCREQDVVARYGGDEFAVVFYDPHGPREAGSKPPAEALFVLDRFKDELATLRVNVKTGESDEATKRRSDEGHARITISGGLATYPWDGDTADGLLAAADEALLAAKRGGKNRVFVVGQ